MLLKYLIGKIDEMYSGYMPIKLGDCEQNQEGSFFFWLAKQRNLNTSPPPKESLVIWLNGGPGEFKTDILLLIVFPTRHGSDFGIGYLSSCTSQVLLMAAVI